MSEIHSVGPFILGKSLGAGSTGKVKLGFHKDTGFKVAIKIMNKEVLSSRPSMRKKVEREIVVMKLIDHPNVLKLHDVYETSKYLFLVTEYVEGGELFDYLINKGSLEPMEALRFFQQIIRGLDHCHSQRICHRDLKPENLLLDMDRNLKIGDFGMAALMRRGSLLGTSCGSPHYASPEVVTGKQYSGMTADVWSCGVILYALLTGKLPFDDDDIRKLLGKVKSGVFTMPAFLPKDAQDLIHRMLIVDPVKRITISQIKEHPWFLSNTPDPQYFLNPVSVEDMAAIPLEDAAAIDDEILRSLKVLGLGSDMDIENALMSKKPSLTLVFYRLLEDRKEKQSNNSYNHFTRGRARSNTHDSRERSFSESNRSPSYNEGKARSNSFTQPENTVTRVLSLNSKTRRPSPLVDAKRGGNSSSQGLIFPLSPSTSANSSTATFSVSDDSATVVSIASSNSSEFNGNAASAPSSNPLNRISPPLSHPQSPRGGDKDKYRKFAQSPPTSPTIGGGSSAPTSPINISNKFRILQLANENTQQLGSSPIIGSNPKRSWFSNFFTGSPHNSASPLDLDEDEAPAPKPTSPVLSSREPHPSHPSHPSYTPHNSRASQIPADPPSHPSYTPHNSRASQIPAGPPSYPSFPPHSSNPYPSHSPHVPYFPSSTSPHSPSYAQHLKQNPTPGSNTTFSANFTRGVGFQKDVPVNSPVVSPHENRENRAAGESARKSNMEMQTGKHGVELGAEIQRTLSALKTSWRLHTNELYTAKYDGAEGSTCQFSVELTDLKHNKMHLVSISHLAGAHAFFEVLCTQFKAEVKL